MAARLASASRRTFWDLQPGTFNLQLPCTRCAPIARVTSAACNPPLAFLPVVLSTDFPPLRRRIALVRPGARFEWHAGSGPRAPGNQAESLDARESFPACNPRRWSSSGPAPLETLPTTDGRTPAAGGGPRFHHGG